MTWILYFLTSGIAFYIGTLTFIFALTLKIALKNKYINLFTPVLIITGFIFMLSLPRPCLDGFTSSGMSPL